jgi:hypothetical protein
MVIVDAFNGELLSLSDKKRKKFVNNLNPFLSQRDADLHLVTSQKEIRSLMI